VNDHKSGKKLTVIQPLGDETIIKQGKSKLLYMMKGQPLKFIMQGFGMVSVTTNKKGTYHISKYMK
jgi:hypothetical protein